MNIRNYIVGQFGKPRGPVGQLAGWIMANRGSNLQRNSWTIDLLDIDATDRVLEIGCGPGVGLERAVARAIGGQVVGLDHSATMLQQAAARNAAALSAGKLELLLGGLDVLDALSRPFDKVFSANVVQFFADKKAAFRANYTAITPGGTIATTYQPRHKNPERKDALRFAEEVSEHMAAAGFSAIRTEKLPLQPVPAICVLGIRAGDCISTPSCSPAGEP